MNRLRGGLFAAGAFHSSGPASTWTGPVVLAGDAYIRSEGLALAFSGPVSGVFGLRIRAALEVLLGAMNGFTGTTAMEVGTLVVNGFTGASDVRMGTGDLGETSVRGSGRVGAVEVDSPSTFTKSVEPGDAASTGVLTVAGLRLHDPATGNHGRLVLRLNGTVAGTEHDVLAVEGTAD